MLCSLSAGSSLTTRKICGFLGLAQRLPWFCYVLPNQQPRNVS